VQHFSLAGVSAAWRAPLVIEQSMGELLAPPRPAARRAPRRETMRAVTVSRFVLHRLSRLRPARWRWTCLYRSVAECLVLRTLGYPARVVIGVGANDDALGVKAHAWVECEGIECMSTRGAAELERLSSRGG
jgi:hypothetical protein